MKTFVFDLDGTICDEDEKAKPKNGGFLSWANYYHSRKPFPEIVNVMHSLRNNGNKISINTSRPASDMCITKRWLIDNEVPFDEIFFDKPRGDFYIDSCALHPSDIIGIF